MIPNILTLLALCAGMTAIRFAFLGQFEAAVGAVILAAVLDGLDGRIARLLKSTSEFGAQLDSFSDFISFGVAPAIMLYTWTMAQWRSVGWALALLFGVCMALRLARFNTQLGVADPPAYAYNFFTGVPAPAAAGLVMLPLCAAFEFGDPVFRSPWLNAVSLVGIALLMISRVPTFSFKRLRVPHHLFVPVMVGAALLAAFLTTAPWPTLVVLGLIYLGSLPFSIRSYYRMKKAAEEVRASAGLRAIETAPGDNASTAAE
ncbi:MAG TPA: CDP-diacylglycerol--serine O-phosphatidyltransferase [Stellaceae bacterium]|nr:CDP-diacylglycerol--serine O-phosphatidyltransferase [Stellaceae bacterium]